MSEKRKFAVFDIDGTFYRGSLYLDVVSYLGEKGLLDRQKLAQHLEKEDMWRARRHKDMYNEYLEATVETVMSSMSLLTAEQVEAAAKAVMASRIDHVYRYTRDLASKLKNDGYFLIAISGSQHEVVSLFVDHYRFDAFACTEWHRTEDGKLYTGGATVRKNNKEKYLQQLILEHDLSMTDSYAVGDSAGDISMLDFVEKPIAFNPEDTLFEMAKQKGWTIVIERKNVIYTLEDHDGSYLLV